jgi:hypothetical protein
LLLFISCWICCSTCCFSSSIWAMCAFEDRCEFELRESWIWDDSFWLLSIFSIEGGCNDFWGLS